jgi:hypothetical protein
MIPSRSEFAAYAPQGHVVPPKLPFHRNTRMSRFWSAVVHGLTPYVPGEQPKLANLVKLNTNENPYGPSPKALDGHPRRHRRRPAPLPRPERRRAQGWRSPTITA